LNTIDDYIATLAPMQQEVAQIMRELIQTAAPQATETIAYSMPAFQQNGKVLVYFAPAKAHLGFYPTPAPIVAFAEQLRGYKTSKGAIQLPYDQSLPVQLIKAIVAYRIKEINA